MNTADTSPIQLEKKVSFAPTSYTVRRTFSFDPYDFKYTGTEKPIEFRGKAMEQFRLDSFWKQIQTNCQEFSKLKKYSKVSPLSFNIGILLLFLGVILLIVGVIPIWGKEKPQNISVVIVAGIFIILSLIQFLVANFAVKKYFKKRLFPQYQEIVVKAVFEHFEDELFRGLKWKGGKDGFKCIEFWYVIDEKSPSINLNTTQTSKLETIMYSEAADMLKRDKDVTGDQSALEIKNFFKESEHIHTSVLELHRESTSVIKIRPVDNATSISTERELKSGGDTERESEMLTAKRLLDGTADEAVTKRADKDSLKSNKIGHEKETGKQGTIKKLNGTAANITSVLKKGKKKNYNNMPEDIEKGL